MPALAARTRGHKAGGTMLNRLPGVCRDAAQELDACGVGLSVLATDGDVALLHDRVRPGDRTYRGAALCLGEGPCIDIHAGSHPVFVCDLGRAR